MKFGFFAALGVISGLAVAPTGLTFAADDAAPVATIDKQPISRLELDARTSGKLAQQKDDYELEAAQLRLSYERQRDATLTKQLGDLIDERVLALEAAGRKTTPVALTDAAKAAPVTDRQVHEFYDSNKDRIGKPFDAMAGQIKDFLTEQSQETARRRYLDSLRAKYHAVVLLDPLRERVAATGPERGPQNAPVTVVEFSDFECPYCGKLAPVMREVLRKYPTQVRLVYRNFPLTGIHPDAQKAAEAGACAQNQGKFWEMHDAMFDQQSSLTVAALKEKARHLGLDTATFDACLDGGGSAAAVKADADAGRDLGLSSTPTTFVNGRILNGSVRLEDISAVIDDELRRDGLTARR